MFALWLFFDTGNADAPEKLDQHLRYLSSDLTYFYVAVYLLIGCGIIILICGFFGWLGAYRESPCMLFAVSAIGWCTQTWLGCERSCLLIFLQYAAIVGLLILCHLLAAILGYAYRTEVMYEICWWDFTPLLLHPLHYSYPCYISEPTSLRNKVNIYDNFNFNLSDHFLWNTRTLTSSPTRIGVFIYMTIWLDVT